MSRPTECSFLRALDCAGRLWRTPAPDDPWATKKGSVLLSGPRQPEVGKSPVTAHCALCCHCYLVVLPLYGFAGFWGANKSTLSLHENDLGADGTLRYARAVIFNTPNPFSVNPF